MNQNHLNTSIYDIALNIGVSLDVKKTINTALTSYLRQLNCLGVVIYKKNNEEFSYYTSKPKTLKKDPELNDVTKKIFHSIEMIQSEYCSKKTPFVIEQNSLYYTLYPLPDFGLLLFVSNMQLSDETTSKALYKLNEKFSNSIIASLQHEKLIHNEKVMHQQSKMASMGEMIANIAHQWRQPLSAISTLATGTKLQMELGVLNNEEILTQFDKVNDIAQHLSTTIEDFRHFFKDDTEQVNFLISEAIKDSLKIIDANLKSNTIDIYLDMEDCHFIGNESSIKQAFINIFNNAKDILVEKQIENRLIYVTLKNQDEEIILNIHDNAGGIPSDVIPKIFDPYFTTKHQSQGTGIGLFMTREILEKQSNCQIEATNASFTFLGEENFGAKFTIKFPKDINDTKI